ncbi:MAG: hypothetical protein L3J00_02205 [Thiomicrorhabdus sp.]|nr:hypothetical protein [Thiomicrorhabdus sp.]
MISGLKTLQNIDQVLASARQDIDRINRDLSRTDQAQQANLQSQTQSLKQLAKIRLDDISQNEFMGELTASDQRALVLIEKRQHAYTQLQSDITHHTNTLEQQERDRSTALEAANEKAQKVINLEHIIQSELEKDSGYQEQLQAARLLDNIADNADEKAKTAEQDRQQKGQDFEQNTLFMYLWKRQYGTPDYNANPLARFLDRWVDRLCNYSQYRVNYWTLLEIPKRLSIHAKEARSASDHALKLLANIETEKTKQAGLPALQEEHTKALKVVDRIDNEIEQQENQLNTLLSQRNQFAENKDDYMAQSLQTLTATLNTKSTYELNDDAHKTLTKQDNLIVREIAELRQQYDDLKEELQEYRKIHENKLDRLQQLEKVRRQFKSRRFDDVRSGFSNGNLITSILGEFLHGLADSSELWRVIERSQRHQDVGAWPDFGSGGLGLPKRRRSPWHLPRGRGQSGGGFRLPKSGGWSSRGGGFRTGGGF